MRMIKKLIYTAVFLIGICQVGFSQRTITSEKYYFSFETAVDIQEYDTESDRVVGYENDDLAVDIEIFDLDQVAKDYFVNLSETTARIARQLLLVYVKTSQKLRNVAQGYYVRATDPGDNTPVFVVVMYHPERKIIYEATIYCYGKDVVAGEKIAQSFRLLY